MPSQPPKVFTSYSHDSSQHVERVLGFSQRLRQDGVDSWIDQYENGTPKEGWPRWMLNRLDWADFVLIVCTEAYYRRFRGKDEPGIGKGADWEGHLVTLDMYNSKSRSVKFVPIIFEDRDVQFIPEPLLRLPITCWIQQDVLPLQTTRDCGLSSMEKVVSLLFPWVYPKTSNVETPNL